MGVYGGYRGYYGCGGGCYPWNSYSGYGCATPSCEYTYYYYAPTVKPLYNWSPPLVYVSAPPVQEVERSRPTVIEGTQIISSTLEQRPQPPTQYSAKDQSLGVADVKALAKAGLSEELVINQVRSSGVVYHFTAAEIIDLKDSGVSEKVINTMISTPPAGSSANEARFKLTGIVSVPEGGFGAVINGRNVVENSYVDGATVKKVDRDQVALDLNGHEVVVRL